MGQEGNSRLLFVLMFIYRKVSIRRSDQTNDFWRTACHRRAVEYRLNVGLDGKM